MLKMFEFSVLSRKSISGNGRREVRSSRHLRIFIGIYRYDDIKNSTSMENFEKKRKRREEK